VLSRAVNILKTFKTFLNNLKNLSKRLKQPEERVRTYNLLKVIELREWLETYLKKETMIRGRRDHLNINHFQNFLQEPF
jgi:hypothetical protein